MSDGVYYQGKSKDKEPRLSFFDFEAPGMLILLMLGSEYLPAWIIYAQLGAALGWGAMRVNHARNGFST